MSKPLNMVLGAVATALITIGVAAQTGSIQLPARASGHGSGGVQARQAASSPSPIPKLSPSASPEAAAAPAAAVAPPPADAQPKHNKKSGG